MDPKKPRKGKPLLLATVGLATVSFVACDPSPSHPVGNLRAPDREPTLQPEGVPVEVAADVDASAPAPAPDDAGQGAPDAGAGASDAGADAGRGGFTLKPLPPYPKHPVGNLRPPPQQPVGNLRAPSSD